MLDQILDHFPAYTHPLTLVHDPDDLLVDETILAALVERGFTLLNEPDPIALRHRVQPLRPFSAERPLIIVTARPLNELPYDLWQEGHQVHLALHTFFPNFSYPVVQSLTPHQRWQLSQAPPPPRRLGRQATLNTVLAQVFEVNLASLSQPAALIAWLTNYHARPDPMPAMLAEYLLVQLQAMPVYAAWPLAELLTDQAAFASFVDRQWRLYLQQQTDQSLAEAGVKYLLAFETDDALQDTLPRLVRSGFVAPVSVATAPDRWPVWMRAGLLAPDEDQQARRISELLELLAEQTAPLDRLAEARWEQWQAIAYTWAEITARFYDPDHTTGEQIGNLPHQYKWWQDKLDPAFLAWLERRYAPLGGQKLPNPHHLYHVLAYITYHWQPQQRVAALIMDGLSLADWHWLGNAWRARHPEWRFQEQLVLAQVPSITAISRQALISGLRPADFDDTLTHNRAEARQWAMFWEQQGLNRATSAYLRLVLDRRAVPPELKSARLKAVCLITNAIDELVHHTSLGTTDLQASLKLWLAGEECHQLELVIDDLLGRDFIVYVTSDHGHTEAKGIGQPSEGLLVETRSKRARVYRDRRTAEAIQHGYADTVLWGEDGLLPANTWALLPTERQAFAPLNETVVTHGGLTLDEMVVPLVRLTRQG